MLNHKQVREVFYYKNGKLFWNINNGPNIVKNQPVGTLNSEGYLQVKFAGHTYKVHRLIYMLYNDDYPERIDHKDTDRLNNTPENLRPATAEQNMQNRSMPETNTTGIKGVDLFSGKYRARITVDGQRHTLGLFDTEEEARNARNEAVKEYHGEFAKES